MRAPAVHLFHRPAPVALVALFLCTAVPVLGDSTVSIASFTAYSVQRYCLQYCLFDGLPNGGFALPRYLGCTGTALNGCFCNTNAASSASSFLTSCVNSYCADDATDVGNAVSLYDNYCAHSLPVVTSAPVVSITKLADFSTQPACVQNCMYSGPPDGGSALARGISCGHGTPLWEECFCRKDLTTNAFDFLSTCIGKWCSGNTDDVAAATSLYTGYCNKALVAAGATATGSHGATAGAGALGSSSGPTATGPGGSSSTSTVGDGGSGGSASLSTSAIIAIAVMAGLVALAAAGALIWAIRRRRPPPSPVSNSLHPSDPSSGPIMSLPSSSQPDSSSRTGDWVSKGPVSPEDSASQVGYGFNTVSVAPSSAQMTERSNFSHRGVGFAQ